MGHDVQSARELEEEHVARVKLSQHHEQTHERRAIRQLIQHGAEFRALIQHPRRVTVKCVQETAAEWERGKREIGHFTRQALFYMCPRTTMVQNSPILRHVID